MNTSLPARRLCVLAMLAFAALEGGSSTAHAQPTAVLVSPPKLGKKSAIELKSAVVAYSEKTLLRASVFAVDGTNRTPVAGGDVEFRVGDQVWGTAKTDASGLATISVRPSSLTPGAPVKTSARFMGKGDVMPSTDTSTLGIVKGSPTWKAVRAVNGSSDVRIDGWIETANAGVGGNTTKVTVNVNGKDIRAVDKWNGINLPFSTFNVGANKIRLQFEGNEYYAPTSTELAFVRKRDTNLYFDPTTPYSATANKSMRIRVRVGSGPVDSANGPLFMPARNVNVKLVEEHPFYATHAKIARKTIVTKAVTDSEGWATIVTSDEWREVTIQGKTSMAGREVDHSLSISIDDDQWRADPKPAHTRAISVK